MSRQLQLRSVLVLAALFATLVVPAAPASADEAPLPDPSLFHLAPTPGEIMVPGTVGLRAVAVSPTGLTSHEVVLDGRAVPSRVAQGFSAEEHIISASVAGVAPGDHIARVTVTNSRGRSVARAWRFTVSDLDVRRLQGADRVATAVRISRDLYPVSGSAGGVLLARADDFADALASVPLARQLDAPLLLTARDQLSAAAEEEIARVLPSGGVVTLLGGEVALSASVSERLMALGYTVERLSGPDRYATATAIAGSLAPYGTMVVASGASFPDALAISSPAGMRGMPVLLTPPDQLAGATQDFLTEKRPEVVFVVGGTAVVSQQVADQIAALGADVRRIAGTDRFDTARRVQRTFFGGQAPVAIASGLSFPDALAGARHAATNGAALLLAAGDVLPDATAAAVGALKPSSATIFGGEVAVGSAIVAPLRTAVLNADGPLLEEASPTPDSTSKALDSIVLEFDRDLQVQHSSVYVELDGIEVMGRVSTGDFPNTLVFQVDHLRTPVETNRKYPVEVNVLAWAGDGTRRHLRYSFTYEKEELGRGDFGSEVEWVQHRLDALGYWLGPLDGQYGSLTAQAVMAFEKANGLPRDGVMDNRVRAALATAGRPTTRSTSGYVIEVDKRRQILMLVRNGVAEWTLNTSTGTETYYDDNGRTGFAHTPTGSFSIYRQIDGLREAPLGSLWRPKYFTGGIAVHGSTSVPAYPASHGCVRLTYSAMDWLWASGRAPIGTRVLVY